MCKISIDQPRDFDGRMMMIFAIEQNSHIECILWMVYIYKLITSNY